MLQSGLQTLGKQIWPSTFFFSSSSSVVLFSSLDTQSHLQNSLTHRAVSSFPWIDTTLSPSEFTGRLAASPEKSSSTTFTYIWWMIWPKSRLPTLDLDLQKSQTPTTSLHITTFAAAWVWMPRINIYPCHSSSSSKQTCRRWIEAWQTWRTPAGQLQLQFQIYIQAENGWNETKQENELVKLQQLCSCDRTVWTTYLQTNKQSLSLSSSCGSNPCPLRLIGQRDSAKTLLLRL